jgi:hypothetical protein
MHEQKQFIQISKLETYLTLKKMASDKKQPL